MLCLVVVFLDFVSTLSDPTDPVVIKEKLMLKNGNLFNIYLTFVD